jgi:hypothetical protein
VAEKKRTRSNPLASLLRFPRVMLFVMDIRMVL